MTEHMSVKKLLIGILIIVAVIWLASEIGDGPDELGAPGDVEING